MKNLLNRIWTFLGIVFVKEKLPWTFLLLTAVATAIQLGGWREELIYNREAIAAGQWWRLWTGHLVHLGWAHFLTDTGLFLLLGRLLERENPWNVRIAIGAMPLIIAIGVYVFDPTMQQYAGLSGINAGLLIFLAGKGWQRKWTDWFWPAVLGIYVTEVVLESYQHHGTGGAMIAFDDPTFHVATSAHIVGAVYGLGMWLAQNLSRKWQK